MYKIHESMKWDTFYHEGIADLITNIWIVMLLKIVSYSIVGIQCLIMLIIYDHRINIIGTILPFIDITTNKGYYLNFAVQMICFAYVTCGNYSSECAACIFNNTITTIHLFESE